MPRTSLNFLANTFFLQDVLPVSNAPMCCLKVLPKSVLDNSQFVIQDNCLSKEKKHCQRTVGQGTPQSPGQPLISRLYLPIDTSFISKSRAGETQTICSRSLQQLQIPSSPPSSLNLALATSFPETSFHANPPLPLLIPEEFTHAHASVWGSQPSHAEGMSQQHAGGRGDAEQGHQCHCLPAAPCSTPPWIQEAPAVAFGDLTCPKSKPTSMGFAAGLGRELVWARGGCCQQLWASPRSPVCAKTGSPW